MQNGIPSSPKDHLFAENVSEQVANGHLEPGALGDDDRNDAGASNLALESENSRVVNGTAPEQPSPRGTKRKLPDDGLSKRQRAISPPWKKVEAEGPTSFVEEGRRKSGRTNIIPLELQPATGKRQTRATLQQSNDQKQLPSRPWLSAKRDTPREARSGQVVSRSLQSGDTRKTQPSSRSSQTTKSVDRPNRTFRTPQHTTKSSPKTSIRPLLSQDSSRSEPLKKKSLVNGKDYTTTRGSSSSQGVDGPPAHSLRSSVPQVRRLRLNYTPRKIPILHPLNLPPNKKFSSASEFLTNDDPLEGESIQRLSNEEARASALTIHKLEQAGQDGGYFGKGTWTEAELETQSGPRAPHTHPDYLHMHILRLKIERDKEKRKHLTNAKRVAHLCLEEWRKRQPRSAEEIQEAQMRRNKSRYKAALQEMSSIWARAEMHVRAEKMKQYEEEKRNQDKKLMNRVLEQSNRLVAARQRLRLENEFDSPGYGTETLEDSTEIDGEVSGDDSDSDSDMTTSDESNNGNGGAELNNEDDELTADQLREKYQDLLEASEAASERDDDDKAVDTTAFDEPIDDANHNDLDPSNYALEEVDETLLDDFENESSDDGTSSDADESGNEDTSEPDAETEAESDDDNDDPFAGLGGFLSKREREQILRDRAAAASDAEEPPTTMEVTKVEDSVAEHIAGEEAEADNSRRVHTALAPGSTSGEPSRQATPTTTKASDLDSASSVPATEPDGMVDEKSLPEPPKIAVSSLLRGQLREYQHKGLEWLAHLYACDTNAILADEMGLGKTIQTIALLSHLATEHHVWGPHLVVVPTSVMLNWELEFKKWCPGFKILTYYGTIEERKQKRRGSADGDKFNVLITSYQLALQDASSLKRRNWHYMILDEAHNIKNFRSQRWQTLLSFKSAARLLLTGTPLQNNLAELWSLLFFLDPGIDDEGHTKFGELHEFMRSFNRPVDQILDQGREIMDDEARRVVSELHTVLRPHLLRRLKADVEKQMPKKYEHVVRCRLSKRQRQLYDGYMGLAGTRESFSSGNYLSIINCLMQLRKVCNHPDLFETRQIVTSYAMPKSAIADYEIKELLVRRELLKSHDEIQHTKLGSANLWQPNLSTINVQRGQRLAALGPLARALYRQEVQSEPPVFDGHTMFSALQNVDSFLKIDRARALDAQYRRTYEQTRRAPVFGSGLLDLLQVRSPCYPLKQKPSRQKDLMSWYLDHPRPLEELLVTRTQRAATLGRSLQRFGFVTPAVVAPDMIKHALTPRGTETLSQALEEYHGDIFHEARVRLSIAFPDKNLIQYDCGKLQQLDKLLRQLQAGGHRALIFTQMTKVLDILERFLNLHGHRYLRLDGSTKIEQRQVMTERFNSDERILAFILSSRSGGLGVNLTGADTVIFYDLDWNPAMDKQCQDRCHRIGQTRDVHIYRFVSEGTIEANILRKSNQKRMLDDVVIQEGDFTTDYFNRIDYRDLLGDEVQEGEAEAEAALDKVLGNSGKQDERLFDVEDREDREAAKTALKEDVQADEVDFGEKTTTPADPATPAAETTSAPADTDASGPHTQTAATPEAEPGVDTSMVDTQESGSIDDYMIRFMQEALRQVVVVPASERARKKAKKGKEFGLKMRKT